MAEGKKRLLLIDGNALVHRAYHAVRPLTVRKTGELVNAVFGFTQMLLKALSDFKPDYLACAFDTATPTFRHEKFEAYKQNRPKTADELVEQFPRVREVVEALGIPMFELERYEADDIIGTLSRQATDHGMETIIVTGDADAMQLVSPQVRVFTPGKTLSETNLYDEQGVLNKYGVPPSKIIDLKGLVGDPSDNIPGVKGIGEKTGLKLLERFGSINGIYEHIDQVEPDKLREKLVEGKAMAFKSRELATIDRNTPVKLDLVSSKSSGHDRNKAIALFQELEFSSLIKKLTEIGEDRPVVSLPESPTRLAGDYKTITSIPELSNITRHLAELPLVAFDVETSGKNSLQSSLVGVSLCAAAGEAFYIPVGHSTLEGINQIPWEMVAALLKPLLSGTKPQKVAHNGKFDMNVLTRYGIEFQSMDFDTMVAACLASEKSLGLKDLAFRRLGLEMTPISDLIGKGSKQVTMDTQPIDMVSAYACADADATFRLWKLLEGEIKKEGLWDLFSNVEMPLVQVLAVIERNGILVDFNILRNMSRRLGEQIAETERNIHKIAEHQFNINSPQQLSKVLFGQFDLKGKHRTKSGYSTDATVLEELRGTHDIIEEVITYRQLTKLKSTYLDALPGLINLKTGRIHTSFNQTSVATGRLSSSDPNLQNIPIKGDLGTEIRKAFVADEGWSFISADYSQIDLRVLAHLSRDPMLVTAFRQDEDIHTATAREVFGESIEKVTPDMRRLAKTINFGVIYGMSAYGLEQASDLSRLESSQFIQSYFDKYKGVAVYLEETKKQTREKGYVETLLGRRRYIPEINSPNRQLREAAERMAINMPVQGTSADIMKVAMIKLHSEMSRRRLKSRLVLQVHDDLLFEVTPEERAELILLIEEIMPHSLKLDVPLKVDIKVGKNWGEMEGYK